MPVVVGVDSSTQATKVEVRDADSGALLASGRAPHTPTQPPRSEQDPNDWWDALRAALAAAGNPSHDAISVAGQQHGMVVLDARDDVIRPAKLWNDTESAPDAARLLGRLDGGADAWARACGSVPVASFTITKLAWLRRAEPEAFARIARVLLPHDYLTFRLTGECVTDRGDASGTGYWSPTSGEWRTDLLRLIEASANWGARVPRVLGPTDSVQARNSEGAIVAAGTGDNMAAALGVGLQPGTTVISLGTSGTVYARSAEPTADASGAVAGFASATGDFLPLVCTLNATKVTDTMMRLMGVARHQFEALAADAPAGANGVVLVPYLDGERTPNRPDARGALSGLRSDSGPGELARAAFEGVVCGLLDGFDALTAAGVGVGEEILLVGGGARSAVYPRVVADLAQRPVRLPDGDEHVALGACVQAAAVLHGVHPDVITSEWKLGAGPILEPNPSVDAAAIRAAYAAARDLT